MSNVFFEPLYIHFYSDRNGSDITSPALVSQRNNVVQPHKVPVEAKGFELGTEVSSKVVVIFEIMIVSLMI